MTKIWKCIKDILNLDNNMTKIWKGIKDILNINNNIKKYMERY